MPEQAGNNTLRRQRKQTKRESFLPVSETGGSEKPEQSRKTVIITVMKINIKWTIFVALMSVLFLAGCSKSNDAKTNQISTPISVKNIGPLHNQILNLYYSKHAFGTKESVRYCYEIT